tara:strand:- start:723 stop:932 length:210 start_codon:yes stop_codon:yes gene_type:complete
MNKEQILEWLMRFGQDPVRPKDLKQFTSLYERNEAYNLKLATFDSTGYTYRLTDKAIAMLEEDNTDLTK